MPAAPAAPPPNTHPPTPGLPGEARLPRGGRVLVIRLSALGDVLFALETVAALKLERPDVVVDFLVEDRFRSLLDGHPQLDRVLVYPRQRHRAIPASLWRLRRQRYDVVLDVHGILKSALHVRCCQSPCKVGPAAPAAREGADRAYHLAVPMPTPIPHRADIGHRLLAAIGLSGRPTAPVLPVREPPPELLADLPRPRVFLHPGTSAFAAFKRWPVGHFAALARELTARGVTVLVGYGPGEQDLAAPALAAAPAARGIDGKALGLLGMAAVMRHCDVVVAADTGPLHLGASVGARCVALFGPKDHLRYGPRAHGVPPHEVLFHPVPCRPCRRRTCVTPQCVLGIPVAQALAAVLRQLAAAGYAVEKAP
jgi:heptosyltransferase-1